MWLFDPLHLDSFTSYPYLLIYTALLLSSSSLPSVCRFLALRLFLSLSSPPLSHQPHLGSKWDPPPQKAPLGHVEQPGAPLEKVYWPSAHGTQFPRALKMVPSPQPTHWL